MYSQRGKRLVYIIVSRLDLGQFGQIFIKRESTWDATSINVNEYFLCVIHQLVKQCNEGARQMEQLELMSQIDRKLHFKAMKVRNSHAGVKTSYLQF